MSDVNDQQNASASGGDDPTLQGNGSGNPGTDREFLQDLPPAEDKRLDDAEVDATGLTDDEDSPFAEE